MTEPIHFVVTGRDDRSAMPAPGGVAGGVQVRALKHSVRLDGTSRAAARELSIGAQPGEDIVVLHLEEGPPLVLHPEHAAALLRAQSTPGTRRNGGLLADALVVRVPQELRWPLSDEGGETRGRVAKVLLRAIEIFKGPLELITDAIADQVAREVVQRFDDQVDEGLYSLEPDELTSLKGRAHAVFSAAGDKPLLVLLHGTFSTTYGTFQKMWRDQRALVRRLFDYYGEVYAFDHPTLGKSPIENALRLVEALPEGARVHCITHSRGGLIAEAIVRAQLDGASDLPEAQPLRDALQKKKIELQRIVRVACPTRGTLLAGRRLDASLSILRWAIQLAGLQVADPIFQLLGQVAQARTDISKCPGLEAMMPSSELVRWLHDAKGQAKGELRVVAGDLQGDSLLSWLKSLPADALFWTDNDLVVQTRSMYGGAQRTNGALFLFARGAQVSHFSYFHATATAEAVVNAAISDAPLGFRKIGTRSWEGKSSAGDRALPAEQPDLPVLFFVPGLSGSGAPSYQPLLAELARSHELVCFDYAWEASLQVAADALHGEVQRKLQDPARSVRVLAHGSGGLVVRSLLARNPEWWRTFASRPGTRVLFVGTPHAGSWRPMQVLSGDDELGEAIVGSRPLLERDALCARLKKAVGLLQLQARLLDPIAPLRQRSTWEKLASSDEQRLAKTPHSWHRLEEQRRAFQWCIPDQETLDRAAAFWSELDSDAARLALHGSSGRISQVLGQASRTPDGYRATAQSFEYLSAIDAGDGSVTDESAWLANVQTWRAPCNHEGLTFHPATVRAYKELLDTGTSRELKPVAAPSRAAASGSSETQSRGSTLSTTSGAPVPIAAFFDHAPSHASLAIEVVNGDLRYVREPLLLGHYRSAKLTGTEAVVDALIGGTMTQALRVGAYASDVRASKIFVNRNMLPDEPHQMPRPQAAVIVGLGDEGKLSAGELAATVCQGVLAWSHRLMEGQLGTSSARGYELAATLIGSGGSGIQVGQAAQLVAQGVRAANTLLAELAEPWPLVRKLVLIELYLDRATEAWNALKIQTDSAPNVYRLAAQIRVGSRPLRRPTQQGYRGARYDFISATSTIVNGAFQGISYTLDTKRARTEVRAQITQVSLLNELLGKGCNDSRRSQLGLTLFRLLIPREMVSFLTGSSEVLLELDAGTAGIPWELLNVEDDPTDGSDATPWAIRSKLIRKLRTAEFRERVDDADSSLGVLVIGEPACDETKYPRLPGARREAEAVASTLRASNKLDSGQLVELIAGDERASCPRVQHIIDRLVNGRWRIIHIAGHGEPKRGDFLGGVVASGGTVIGPVEISKLSVTPELVFLNCCHLAKREEQQLLKSDAEYDRVRFAADIAEELIRNGVRCVVAAGWAVNDMVAETFAKSFYDALINGRRPFADAVACARQRAHEASDCDTWAAYQCYGDPDWTFHAHDADSVPAAPSNGELSPTIAHAEALILVLDEITVRAADKKSRERLRERLALVEKNDLPHWEARGRVQEAMGNAWSALGERPRAIEAFQRAIAASHDPASFHAIEQLGNLLVLQAESREEPLSPEAREEVLERGIKLIELVLAIAPNSERLALRGSAYKRKAMMRREHGDEAGELSALEKSLESYEQAERLALANHEPGMFYPALNRLAISLVVGDIKGTAPKLDDAHCAAIARCLENQVMEDPDFWSVIGRIELAMYRALAAGRFEEEMPVLLIELRDLHARDSAPRRWKSFRDQLRFLFARATGTRKVASDQLQQAIERWSME